MASALPDSDSDFFVYVLRNGAGTLYTGIAKDVDARLALHNANAGARFTRGRGPWQVVHTEGPLAHGDALRREAALKRDRRFKAGMKGKSAGPKPLSPGERGWGEGK
jgi:putative endonuclease